MFLILKQLGLRSVLSLVAASGILHNPSLHAQSKSAETRISVIDSIGQDMVKMLDNLTEGERDPTKRLPLRPVVDKVLTAVDQAPVFRQADTSVALAKGQKREALSRFLPQISAGVGKGTRTFDTQTADGLQEQSGSYEQRSIQVSQLIFDFGTSIFNHSAASRRLEAAEAKKRAMRSEVMLATVTSFYEVQRALLQVRLSRENLAARRSFVEFVKERTELGASSSADVVRAQSRVAEALDALSSSLQSLSRAQATYRQYFADEAEPYTLPGEIETEDLNLNNIEEYIQSHPLLVEAELNKDAAQKEFYAARGQLIGGIYAEASLSDTKDPGETEFRSDNTFTVRFKADLFTGGSQTAQVAQSSARYDLASLELDKVRLDLVRDLRDAFAEYNGNIAAVSARMLVFKGAEDSYAISKDLYAFSRTSLFEVLKSQEELYTAGQRLIDSIISRAISKYRLLHASQQLVDRMQRVMQ
jgi:outer membrane protein, adhesin transport system